MGILQRVVQQTSRDQTGRMRHVDHQQSTYFVGDLTHTLVIPITRIGGATTDDQFGFLTQSNLLHLIIIHATRLLIYIVLGCPIENTRAIDR